MHIVGALVISALSLMYDEQVEIQKCACTFVSKIESVDNEAHVTYHNIAANVSATTFILVKNAITSLFCYRVWLTMLLKALRQQSQQ